MSDKTDFDNNAKMFFDAMGQVIDNFLEIAEKKKYDGCETFNAISRMMAIRLGQIEGLHVDYDFKSKGLKIDVEYLKKAVPQVTQSVVQDFLGGLNQSLKDTGNPSLTDLGPDLGLGVSEETDKGEKDGNGNPVYH